MKKKKEERHVYVVTTYKMTMPKGGTLAQRNKLLLQYFKEVTKKNNKILSSKTLVHYYGSDGRDLVIINEYKTWADIEQAEKISEKLINKKWPSNKKRRQFFRQAATYFDGYKHSDEIYTEMPMFRK